ARHRPKKTLGTHEGRRDPERQARHLHAVSRRAVGSVACRASGEGSADPMTAPRRDDAAPCGNGASVNDRNTSPHLTRLPLTPPARRNAPAGTSDLAAVRIGGHAAKLRERVYAFIVGRGADGATDDEGEAALGIKPQT